MPGHYTEQEMEKEKKESREFGPHIVQYPPDVSFCAGCSGCAIVCSLIHDGVVGHQYSRIFVDKGTRSMVTNIYTCQHCADHPCYHACSRRDQAMCVDEKGIVYINEEHCIGCKRCIKACVFDPPRINYVRSADKSKRKAKKCDLCRTRPEGPACVEYCQVSCIGVSGGGKHE